MCLQIYEHVYISLFHLGCAMETCSREIRKTTGNGGTLNHCPSICCGIPSMQVAQCVAAVQLQIELWGAGAPEEQEAVNWWQPFGQQWRQRACGFGHVIGTLRDMAGAKDSAGTLQTKVCIEWEGKKAQGFLYSGSLLPPRHQPQL